MSSPFTIQIYYPDGDPENVRIVKQKNWTGNIVYVSRNFWAEKDMGKPEALEALKAPGVYFLVGIDEESDDNIQRLYIGQAEDLYTRIKQHIKDPSKSFWESVVCVTSTDDFNNAHYRWMESDLITSAKKIDRCISENDNQPTKPKISKSDEVDTQNFLNYVIQTLPIVEINVFVEPKIATLPQSMQETEQEQTESSKQNKLPAEKISEIKNKILIAFQEKEKVKLLERSRATFYNKPKQTHVCCTISKNYEDNDNSKSYWFVFHKKWKDFLESGNKGYLILGMEKQPKAIIIPIKELNEVIDKITTKEGLKWNICISETNGVFKFINNKQLKDFDLSKYLLEIN